MKITCLENCIEAYCQDKECIFYDGSEYCMLDDLIEFINKFIKNLKEIKNE